MSRQKFGAAAGKKINDYIITLEAKSLDAINQQVRPFQFRRTLGDWVAQQTGCVPEIEIMKESVGSDSPKMLIQCTDSLMKKIRAQFPTEIADVEFLPRLSDIPPSQRGCWKPSHGK